MNREPKAEQRRTRHNMAEIDKIWDRAEFAANQAWTEMEAFLDGLEGPGATPERAASGAATFT